MSPILYSFRRCPYAIRARMAIKYSGIVIELREVILADKPEDMLINSPKGTVPVLILPDGTVIDESEDIMHWALAISDSEKWLPKSTEEKQRTKNLIDLNAHSFKKHLDHYKYAARFPEHPAKHYRDQAEIFLQQLDNQLNDSNYLFASHITLADIAIFPFIRQFAFVDKNWFDQTPYQSLQTWLNALLKMKHFTDVIQKYPKWRPGDEVTKF